MSTNYPSSLDSFVDPTAGEAMNSPSHSSQHANINDAMAAVQSTLGANLSNIAYAAASPTGASVTDMANLRAAIDA